MTRKDIIYAIIIGGMALIMAMDKLRSERFKNAFYVDLNILYADKTVILKFEDGGYVRWIFKETHVKNDK